MEAITKKCTKCGEVKSLSAFYKDKSRKDGLYPQCKGCKKANAGKIAEYNKTYRKANADKIAEHNKAYADKKAEHNKAYRKANADKIAEYHKAYYKANADKIAEYKKAYRKANADKIAEYNKANVDNLTSAYIARQIGLPIADIPPEFMELKRTQLKLHRLIKQKTIT